MGQNRGYHEEAARPVASGVTGGIPEPGTSSEEVVWASVDFQPTLHRFATSWERGKRLHGRRI